MSNRPNPHKARKSPAHLHLPNVLVKGWGRMPFWDAAAQFARCDCGFDLWISEGGPEPIVLENHHEPGCPVLAELS